MSTSFSAAFPNGVSSGDVTQTSAVLWTRAVQTGKLTIQIATDATFSHLVKVKHTTVTDPLEPVKIEFQNLKPGEEYFYRVIDADGDVLEGRFETSAELGTYDGFHFGVGGDTFAELAPYVSIENAATAGLDLFIMLGDSIYADLAYVDGALVPTSTTTLEEFRLKHNDVYSSQDGINVWAELRATTPILSMIDDHEVIDDYAGGAHPNTDLRFDQTGDFINETQLFANGIRAFNDYNAIENRVYTGTGDDLFDGAPDLYRYNTYGSDAAVIMVDARSFRDAEIPAPLNPLDPFQIFQFLSASYDPTRTMLGDVQFDRLAQDLLDARDNGVTWKFVMLPEPIQNFGPIISPGDRYEGYAAERNALLKFIDDHHIENVVFVSSDSHWTSVNNLTYQNFFGGPQIASSAFEVNTLAIASIPIAPFVAEVAHNAGLLDDATFSLYQSLPQNNAGNAVRDIIVKAILDGYMTQLLYDPIGLENSGIDATLKEGSYFIGHSFGWTEFDIDVGSQKLLVTTHGIPIYTDPADVDLLSVDPAILSQFEVTPTSDSIIGTEKRDRLSGTADADVILGAAGSDVLKGHAGDDYLDGGNGQDLLYGGESNDVIYGRDGNDWLRGGDGGDLISGDAGNDRLVGGEGDDVLIGGLGIDVLSGGTGNDTFQFDAALSTANVDRITDYNVGDDTIRLANDIFTALTSTGILAADNFVVGTAAVDGDDYIIFNVATGALYYDADGNGEAEKVKFASLDSGLAVTSSDFFVV